MRSPLLSLHRQQSNPDSKALVTNLSAKASPINSRSPVTPTNFVYTLSFSVYTACFYQEIAVNCLTCVYHIAFIFL